MFKHTSLNAALIAVAAIALTAASANAAIIVEDTAVGGDGRESSDLASFTTTADTDLLLVGNAGYFGSGAATAMSFNGESLTEVPNSRVSQGPYAETVFFYLFDPGAHTGTISVTRSGKDFSDTDEIVAYAIGGVTAIDQIVASTTGSGSGDEISLTQTVSGSGLAIDLLAVELNSSINPSPGTGQTEVMDAVASDNDGKFNLIPPQRRRPERASG
jgi:hypothetical protein